RARAAPSPPVVRPGASPARPASLAVPPSPSPVPHGRQSRSPRRRASGRPAERRTHIGTWCPRKDMPDDRARATPPSGRGTSAAGGAYGIVPPAPTTGQRAAARKSLLQKGVRGELEAAPCQGQEEVVTGARGAARGLSRKTPPSRAAA